MTYELAKQLKDAGFKTESHGRDGAEERGCYKGICVPTLSELIAACGEDFGELNHYRNSGDWEVVSQHWKDKQGVGRMASGKTPEEAVAKLWLALNAVSNDRPISP